MTELTYIGHSAFYIHSDDFGILIDPFISQNPNAKFDFNGKKITDIFVSHGHGDHLGDAIPISKQTGAPITAVYELANYCADNGASVNAVGLGGKTAYSWGSARLLPAFHSSSTPDGVYAGMPAAVLIDIKNAKKIYHCGDTCLNKEMELVGEVYKPDIALIPIGSCFTMDIDEAVIAARKIGAHTVIPMHYNTFGAINADAREFKKRIEAEGKECLILNAGDNLKI